MERDGVSFGRREGRQGEWRRMAPFMKMRPYHEIRIGIKSDLMLGYSLSVDKLRSIEPSPSDEQCFVMEGR